MMILLKIYNQHRY